MSERFSATIFKAGINPCVDVPPAVSAALAKKGYIPVACRINGHPFRTGLVPLRGARHRLFINGQMRRRAAVDVGDEVDVVLWYDPSPRTEPVPEQLARALAAHATAREAWQQVSPSRRKEILRYLNALKRPDSVARNVERLLARLLAP